jgi:hypothetical protein
VLSAPVSAPVTAEELGAVHPEQYLRRLKALALTLGERETHELLERAIVVAQRAELQNAFRQVESWREWQVRSAERSALLGDTPPDVLGAVGVIGAQQYAALMPRVVGPGVAPGALSAPYDGGQSAAPSE